MLELSASNVISYLVTLFFIIGAVVNWIAPPKIANDYARWGYPPRFHYLTAVLEGLSAILLLLPTTRLFGATLGALVMSAAALTLLRHRENGHAVVPTVVLGLCIAAAALQ